MKCGRWRMRYRLTSPIRGSGYGWVARLQSKWDSPHPETLFQKIALEPSFTKEKYSLAKSTLKNQINIPLRRPNSLQKTQCFYVCVLLLVKLILRIESFVSAEGYVRLFLLQECRYYSHITFWLHTRISL